MFKKPYGWNIRETSGQKRSREYKDNILDKKPFDTERQKQLGKGERSQKDIDKSSESTQTCLPCFPAAPAMDPSTASRVLSSWRSLQNLENSMSDKAGPESNASNLGHLSPVSTTKKTLVEDVDCELEEHI
jgi:hypothetical protein